MAFERRVGAPVGAFRFAARRYRFDSIEGDIGAVCKNIM
jgi:hypothetical protein